MIFSISFASKYMTNRKSKRQNTQGKQSEMEKTCNVLCGPPYTKEHTVEGHMHGLGVVLKNIALFIVS